MLRFASTIFLSAFLLFQVQPIVGKYVLPWFGGSPSVWSTCMLSFQMLLLAGYAYAHWTTTRCSRRTQGLLHLGLLGLSLISLQVVPDDSWKPHGDESPTFRILLLLLGTVGLPYFLLSTTGPLLQSWFAQSNPGRSPFRLYALSNFGSLLALLSYPFLVEPYLRVGVQAEYWTGGYIGFAICCGWNAVRTIRDRLPAVGPFLVEPKSEQTPSATASTGTKLLWLLLSATASVLLLATTNQMCQEVAVTPLLWIVPLAMYLVSFILTFDAPRWYRRDVFGPLFAVAAPAAWYVVDNGPAVRLDVQLVVYCVAFFASVMICHGELVRNKPQPSQLTLFYLLISLGGALGGAFVSLAAPVLFRGYWEYQLGLGGTAVLLLVCLDRDAKSPFYRLRPLPAWCVFACLTLSFCIALGKQALGSDADQVAASRNFYGLLRVVHRNSAAGPQVAMIHGRIVHGLQSLDDAKRRDPTSYYGPDSGIGLTMRFHPKRAPKHGESCGLRVGVVGLGAGTTATYGTKSDEIRFYEINPDVVRLATEHFSYLGDSSARIEVVLGDARIKLEEELRSGATSSFDVLAIDAFSGDAIPTHLLTREAFALYARRLADDGMLALHVSNDHLDLSPLVRGLAEEAGYQVRAVRSADDPLHAVQRSDWLIVTKNDEFLNESSVANHFLPIDVSKPAIRWTDDFSSLRQVLKYDTHLGRRRVQVIATN